MQHLMDIINRGRRNPLAAVEALEEIQRMLPQFDVSGPALSRGSASGQHSPRTEPYRDDRTAMGAKEAFTPRLGPLLSSFLAPTRIIEVPGFEAIAAGSESKGTVQFQGGGGWIIGWRMSVKDLNGLGATLEEALSVLEVKFDIDGRHQKVSNGKSVVPASASNIFPQGMVLPYQPLLMYVNQRDNMDFFVSHLAASTLAEITPAVTLFYLDDPLGTLASWFCLPDMPFEQLRRF